MITDTDKVWMAGVLDACGRIIFSNKAQTYGIRVRAIGQRGNFICQNLSEYSRNRVSHSDSRIMDEYYRKGCDEHCPSAHVHVPRQVIKESSSWGATGVSLTIILFGVLPFIRCIQADCQKALEFGLDINLASGKGGTIAKKISEMKAIGWDIPEELELFGTHFACGHVREGNTISIAGIPKRCSICYQSRLSGQ